MTRTRVSNNTSEFISVSASQVQDTASKEILGDREQRFLELILQLERFTPRDLIEKGFAKDRKEAWWWINIVGIKRLGVVMKLGRGLYAVIREKALKLIQKPVKRISEGIKRRRIVKTDGGSRQRMGTRSCLFVEGVAGSVGLFVGCGVGGVLGYAGLWIDNGRFYDVWGRLHRQGRRVLWSLGVFENAERVVYFEATHVVTNVVLDGVVVVYTNVEDFERFGGASARVEWRPPSGFVKRRGVAATLRKALEEYVKAFKALWIVLINNLSKKQVLQLLKWQLSTLKRYGLESLAPMICFG